MVQSNHWELHLTFWLKLNKSQVLNGAEMAINYFTQWKFHWRIQSSDLERLSDI